MSKEKIPDLFLVISAISYWPANGFTYWPPDIPTYCHILS